MTGKGAGLGRSGRLTGERTCRAAALLATVPLVAACGLLGGAQQLRQDAPQVMTVTSPAFGQGIIPGEYTCHGRGGAPPLFWCGGAPGTETLGAGGGGGQGA